MKSRPLLGLSRASGTKERSSRFLGFASSSSVWGFAAGPRVLSQCEGPRGVVRDAGRALGAAGLSCRARGTLDPSPAGETRQGFPFCPHGSGGGFAYTKLNAADRGKADHLSLKTFQETRQKFLRKGRNSKRATSVSLKSGRKRHFPPVKFYQQIIC